MRNVELTNFGSWTLFKSKGEAAWRKKQLRKMSRLRKGGTEGEEGGSVQGIGVTKQIHYGNQTSQISSQTIHDDPMTTLS